MKICFLSSMHPPLDKRVFDKEALTLAHAGYEVVHVCPGEPGITEEQGVKIVQYKAPGGIWARIAQIPRLYKLARAENADVYHCNEVDSWVVGAFLCRRRRVCIFDVHEHYPSTYSESRFPRFLRPLVANSIRLLYRILEPWTDYFVLAKQSLAPDFQHAAEKVRVIRNFSRTIPRRTEEPSRTSNGEFVAVHLGAIGRARGWPQLLDALALLKTTNIRLKVVGSFIDHSQSEFWKYARQLGVENRIEFSDWLPFEQAFQVLRTSSVGLILFQPGILNHVYASPHKFFDYMAAGLPVIAPKFAEEIATIMKEHDVGLLIDPADPRAIADALIEIRANPDWACRWGDNGVAAVRDKFNWEQEAASLISLYQLLPRGNLSQ